MKFPLFKKNAEKFLVVEVAPDGARGLLFKIGEDRKLVFLKNWDDFKISDFEKRSKWSWDNITTIVAAHPSLVFNATIPVSTRRAGEEKPLNAPEMENFLGQAVSRVFNEWRSEASRALGTLETHTVLISSRVHSIKIDGYRVVNPVGFPAKDLKCIVDLVFIGRTVYDQLKFFFRGDSNFFFTDLSRAALAVLAKKEALLFGLLTLGLKNSRMFVMRLGAAGVMIKDAKIPWSYNAFFDYIAASLDVSESVARQIYETYLKKEVSAPLERKLRQLFKPVLDALFSELSRMKFKGKIFLEASYPLPFLLPFNRGGMIFELPSIREALNVAGIAIDLARWPIPENELFPRLAPFLEFYHDKGDHAVNHYLKRRLHWLGAVVK